MAAELSTDLTFFNGIINDNLLQNTGKNVLEKSKSCRKSNGPETGKKTRTSKSPKKDNPKTTEKPKRLSKKPERQPLAPLSVDINAPKKDNVSLKKESVSPKKKSVSPSKAGVTPKTRRSVGATATEKKVPKKERQSVPKIIVYQDSPAKGEGKKKEGRKPTQRQSKSLDGTGRRATSKSPESCNKNWHSFNDLTNVDSSGQKGKNAKKVDKSTTTISNPRRKTLKPGNPEFDAMLEKLESLFPNVDPEFLKSQFSKFKGSISQTVECIIIKEKMNELPTRDDYVRRTEMERIQNKFLENFSVAEFLKMIPDPWEYFLETEKHNSVKYLGHSLHYLKNKYKKHYTQAIHDALKKSGNSLYLANKELKKKNRSMKMRVNNRSKNECEAGRPTTFNAQFLHEVAFIENESKIKSYIKKTESARYKKFKDAENAGTLLECQSCNDFSLLPDDVVNCPANHVFCKNCVVKYVEVEIEKDNFQFKCLIKCEERLSVESLQTVLSPFVTAKIIRRQQLEEIKAAGIEDLAACPFCFYVAIVPKEVTIFKCLNPVCLIESCRLCKQFNHIPLKCQELEELDKTILEVQVEVNEEEEEEVEEVEEIEEKEKERTPLICRDCSGEFLKREDSNQMVCQCGAIICSVCQQPFPGCSHVNTTSTTARLSVSSDDVDVDINAENIAEANPDPDSLQNFMGFLSSDSDTF